MKFPIELDSPEERLCKEIAKELTIEGFDSTLSLPFAMGLVRAVDASHDDPSIGIEMLRKDRKETDAWWVKYWPDTEYAKASKERLEGK